MKPKEYTSSHFFIYEAESLLERLEQVQPFVLNMPSVPAANIPLKAQKQIDRFLKSGKIKFKERIGKFIRMVRQTETNHEANQRIYALLKLSFNALLDKLDIFADVLTQRSEQDTGILLAGLDRLAKDALSISGGLEISDMPEVICYLDRGHGAAIRRARTRMPGGTLNPVAIIRVPRERLIGSGIASSLIHEVGHQGAVLLGLIDAIRISLKGMQSRYPNEKDVWGSFERWISEILADLWSIGLLGIGSTMGLIGVVSLPRYFVFRNNLDGPHPFPFIRVLISIAFGKALYPDQQWMKTESLWKKLYPVVKLPKKERHIIQSIEKKLPDFVRLVLNHSSKTMNGHKVKGLFPIRERSPIRLRKFYKEWGNNLKLMEKASPSLVFAVIGQAKSDGSIDPKKEYELLKSLLKTWAVQSY